MQFPFACSILFLFAIGGGRVTWAQNDDAASSSPLSIPPSAYWYVRLCSANNFCTLLTCN